MHIVSVTILSRTLIQDWIGCFCHHFHNYHMFRSTQTTKCNLNLLIFFSDNSDKLELN